MGGATAGDTSPRALTPTGQAGDFVLPLRRSAQESPGSGGTPAQYQRQVRLERARLELLSAGPGDGMTVASVAGKWGWASAAQFTVAYRQRFGAEPTSTPRG